MTDPQTFITHMTNMVYLSTLTQVLHSTAYEEAQNETAQPLNQAIGSFTSADMKEAWELTHQNVTTAVREIQAQAWEEGHTAGWQEHHDCYITNTRDPENPADKPPNPYKEN